LGGASSPPQNASAPDADGVGRAPPQRILARAFSLFRAHQMTDYAATLTYFAMMSLFPALLVGVALLGLFGQQSLVTDAGSYLLRHGADASTATVARNVLDKMINSSGGALGLTLAISIVIALNGASGAFGAAGRALNVVYGVQEARGFVRRKLIDVGATLLVIVLFVVVLAALFLGGQIADDLFGTIGLGSTAAAAWSIARWPVALVAAMLGHAVVYGLAPNVEPRRIRWISPGAAFAVVLWIVLSIGFGIYIKNFSSYGAAYGAFGAAIVLLLWLYLSANALLFGAELNAEIERTRRAARDAPPFPTPPPTPAPAGRSS
jgi:membrane protein